MQPSVNVIEEPPALTSGSGIPVMGMSPVTAAMFMSAWATTMAVSPPAMSLPNGSFASMAIRMPAYANTRNASTTTAVPTSPSSSPMTAKMKSVCAAGR